MRKKPLGRRGRTLGNFLLALVCLFFTWAGLGAPLPSRELAFQRLQREYLLTEPAPMAGVYQETWPSGEQETAVGVNPSYLVFGNLDSGNLSVWPRQGDGPVLAPAPDSRMTVDPAQPGGGWLIAADAPEGTASAVLTARLSCWYTLTGIGDAASVELSSRPDYPWRNGPPSYWEETYTGAGESLGDGMFRFSLSSSQEPDRSTVEALVLSAAFDWDMYLYNRPIWDIRSQMTAVFYDETGAELDRAELKNAEAWER